jgi:hypothetical protein
VEIDVTGMVVWFFRDHTTSAIPSNVASMDVRRADKYVFTAALKLSMVAVLGRRVGTLRDRPVAGQYRRPRPEAPGTAVRREETREVWKG